MANIERNDGPGVRPEIPGLDLGIARNPSTGGEGPLPPAGGKLHPIEAALKPRIPAAPDQDTLAEARIQIGPNGNFSRNSV
ncbi:hypothetical protein HYW44_00165 [Candidatus Daviesbacteria bacterium]|nr:hypothetical protein [Candidatus Daviesbacteria bacterium]